MRPTFVEDLHDAGYYTGLVGKYLNSWDGSRRDEFDFWVSFAWGEAAYFDPVLNIQGDWREQQGYITYLFQGYALEFLDQALAQDKPFFLLFTPNAPHEPALPAPGDENLYPDLQPYRPPSFNEEDIDDKPEWLHGYESFKPERILAIDELRRAQLQSLNALDLAVESLVTQLEQAGELDNTFIIYLSDNGFYWGEHRRNRGKGYAWEESIHVPMAIRFPPLVTQPRRDNHMVANLDIAPTIYQLAGLPVPPDLDGQSLLPLLAGEKPSWRDRLVIENWIRFGPYLGVRTKRYLYVEWEHDKTELYDMEVDPYQLENQAENPAYSKIVSSLHEYLESVREGED
jgi:arylsulfatase A-like enzyme